MSRILIAYATKTGSTARCAELFAAALEKAGLPEPVIADLSAGQPDPAAFDGIVVGGSIRAGRLHRRARAYLIRYAKTLAGKPFAFFLCNAADEQTETLIRENLPEPLLRNACCTASFGGNLELGRQTGFDRLIVRAILDSLAKEGRQPPRIHEERIRPFADTFAAAVRNADTGGADGAN